MATSGGRPRNGDSEPGGPGGRELSGLPEQPATTPEGQIEGMGRMASQGSAGGWKRWATIGVLVLFLVPVLWVMVDTLL